MQNALNIKDKLGCPIEPCIIETVVVLNLLGFCTKSSCEGHVDHITEGPSVMFESKKSNGYACLARENGDYKSKEYQQFREKANRYRMLDFKKMSEYLEQFYSNRPINYGGHIIIESLPMSLNILRCHNAEMRRVLNKTQSKKVLQQNQEEMLAFTAFLKQRFFEN